VKAIYLSDKNISYEEAQQLFVDADKWAQDTCSTYQGYKVEDVSDFSWDGCSILVASYAEYIFEGDQDAVVFKLRWK